MPDPYDARLDALSEARYDGPDDREQEERDRYNALGTVESAEGADARG